MIYQSFEAIEYTQNKYQCGCSNYNGYYTDPRNDIDGIRGFFCFKITPGKEKVQSSKFRVCLLAESFKVIWFFLRCLLCSRLSLFA